MSKGVDSNLFQLLMAHVDQHIPRDLGIKCYKLSLVNKKKESEVIVSACHRLTAQSRWQDYYSPLGGILVHRSLLSRILSGWSNNSLVSINTQWWGVRCLAKEYTTLTPVRARTRTA